MRNNLQIKIEFEIDQIDKMLLVYESLFLQLMKRAPNKIELSACANLLHSFYSGLENIFSLISKQMDHDVPNGMNWHRDLLIKMTVSTSSRKAVIDRNLYTQLLDYLSFRHFFRHSYTHNYDWIKMEALFHDLHDTWRVTKESLLEFTASMQS